MAPDLEGGQNRRELARIARPMRVLESRSRRANGSVFRPKRAHKTKNNSVMLPEIANRAVVADARRKSVDEAFSTRTQSTQRSHLLSRACFEPQDRSDEPRQREPMSASRGDSDF